MNEISLELIERTESKKKVAALRRSGMVPSVVYGGHATPLTTKSPLVETTKAIRSAGFHTPVHLMVKGKKKLAMVKDVDIDPVKHYVRHVSFHAIKQNEKIVTSVPIVLAGEGTSEAEKMGLVILQALDSVEIRALPSHLPESLEVSVEKLANKDDKLTITDITLPEGVEFADQEQSQEIVIANVYEPGALQSAAEAEQESGESIESSNEVASDDAA